MTSLFLWGCFYVLNFITLFILFPISLHSVMYSYLYRNRPEFKKRNIKLSILSSFAWIIQFIVLFSLYQIHEIMVELGADYFSLPKNIVILNFINGILSTIINKIGIYSIFARYWITFYTFTYVNAIENAFWKKELNDGNNLTKNEIWLVNKSKTLGNGYYIFKRACIVALIVIIIDIIPGIIDIIGNKSYSNLQIYLELTNTGIWCIELIVFFVIWSRTPKFDDNLYLYTELKYLVILWVFSSLYTLGLHGSDIIFPGWKRGIIDICAWYVNGVFFAFLAAMIQTYFVNYKLAHFSVDELSGFILFGNILKYIQIYIVIYYINTVKHIWIIVIRK